MATAVAIAFLFAAPSCVFWGVDGGVRKKLLGAGLIIALASAGIDIPLSVIMSHEQSCGVPLPHKYQLCVVPQCHWLGS